jgi:iron complex transport system substrate-binding protein
MLRKSVWIAFILALACFLACSDERGGGEQSFTITDDRGKEVVLPRPVTRLVSLGPSFTEVIFVLGGEDKLIGVTTYCDYPPPARQKPKVGDFLNPSIERIVALEPDCVLTTGPSQARTTSKLERLGLNVVQLNPESIAGVERCIRTIGQIVAEDSTAERMIAELRESIGELRLAVSRIEKRRSVFLEIDTNPLVTASPGSFLGELLELAGARNIVETGSGYPVINPEHIVKMNPEVIIMANPAVSLDEVKGRVGWEQVSAVRYGRIRRVDPSLISRPGPRAVVGAAELHRLIYSGPANGEEAG